MTIPTIKNRKQLEVVVENILALRSERAALEQAQEAEIAAIREKYRIPLAGIVSTLNTEMSWVEAWAKDHPEEFGGLRFTICAGARLAFTKVGPFLDTLSRKWTWAKAREALQALPWGEKFLRQPPLEIDKEAVMAARASLSIEDLRAAGLKVVDGERFSLEAA